MPEIPETELVVTIAVDTSGFDTSGFDAAVQAAIEAPIRADERRKVAEEIEAYREQCLNRPAGQRPDAVTALAIVARAARGERPR